MTLPHPLGAVILDMDGTLHDTEGVYHRALTEAVRGVGFSVTDAFCHSLIGIPGPESDEMLIAHLGPDFPFAEFDRRYEDMRNTALATVVPLKAGALELLDALALCAMKVAVATSASRRAAELHLGLSGLRARLPVIVTRDDVARGKPHPDAYLRAAEFLGVPPQQCLAVEDSFNGIRAARAAGMMPVMVPDLLTPTHEIRAMSVCIARDLHEVRVLVAEHIAIPPYRG